MINTINQDKRPHSEALITAIEKAIEDIAADNMTPIEVLGVLDLVSKRLYEDKLSSIRNTLIDAGIF